MWIEFRRVLDKISSHRVVRILVNQSKVLLSFEYSPDRENPEPFAFVGPDLLRLAEKGPEDFFKAYFIGVDKEPSGKLIYHILENHQDIMTINKHTNFQLVDVVPIIK